MGVHFEPGTALKGSLRPPADKSISHRAALIAAMCGGESVIEGYLDAADTRSTLAAISALGAEVSPLAAPGSRSAVSVRGVGLRGAAPARLDVGNAGTLLRLVAGWLAGQPGGRWHLDGDQSIRTRPLARIVGPLREMGAQLRCREDDLAPLEIEGAALRGISYRLALPSAQVKSCLLFAGLLAEGETRLTEPLRSRDHTERMLAACGAQIKRSGELISLRPAAELAATSFLVPGDFSSAAFWLLAAVLIPGSDLTLAGVGLNPTRTGFLAILERMGARLQIEPDGERGGEPIGAIRVRGGPLAGVEVGGAEIPLAIDELSLVALAGCFAQGTTRIREAAELRRKESDRIASVATALRALGATVETSEEEIWIEGDGGLRGGAIDSGGDHRIAMMGAIAGLASERGVEVEGMEAAAVSYPGFEADLRALSRR